ncbi:MAG: glycosyltransferase family 39 protein [Abditibacteriales bacterium]|nr:glycosyltransferase family 39 protein [Abditibacteriales bacterium]MDW8365268.1 glycosyltransferase family 39 protein [Abditibacteriales bacterium]
MGSQISGQWSVVSRQWLYLALAAAILRCFRVGHQSFWFDEVFSLSVVQGSLSDLLQLALKDAVHPPLYYLVLYPFYHLSASEFVVRLPSVLFGIAAVPLIYELGRRCLNERVGLIAAVVMLFSPFQIYYAQEARMYAMLLTLTALSLLAFWQAIETGERKWWVALVVVTAAGLYTHYLMAAVAAAEFLYLLRSAPRFLNGHKRLVANRVAQLRTPQRFWHGIAAFACIAVLYAPWLYGLLRHGQSLGERHRFGSVQEANLAVFGTFLDFCFGYFQGLWLLARARHAEVAFAFLFVGMLLAAIVFAVGFVSVLRIRFARGFLLLALAVPIVAGYLLACKTYYHQTRYFMPAYPAFALLFAAGMVRLYERRRGLGVAAVSLIAFINAVALMNYYFADAYQRDDWRGVARFMQRHAQPNDLLIFNAPYKDQAFRRYYHKPFHYLGLPRPGMTQADVERLLREQLRRHARIHLVLCYWEVSDPDAKVRRTLDALCQRRGERKFAGIDVLTYQRDEEHDHRTTRPQDH